MGITGKSDDAFTVLSSKLNTLKAAFDLLDAQIALIGQKTIFPIWAEENGALASNAYEWSWGNGATGNDIGIPLPVSCELFASSFNADVFGTSVSVIIEKNGTSIATPLFENNNTVFTELTPIQFAVGDRVSFKTGTVVGTNTDARICAWFRTV